jgi:phospholipid/cholesterol/gamma-HCH transport system permease protein
MDDDRRATFEYQQDKNGRGRLILRGRLDRDTTATLWLQSVAELRRRKPERLIVDAGEVDYCDGAGLTLLAHLKRLQKSYDGQIEIRDLRPEFQQLMERFETDHLVAPPAGPGWVSGFIHDQGGLAIGLAHDFFRQVSFTGEVFVKLVQVALRPHTLRWRDTFLIVEKAGANAIGITALLGFLIGLILAFQSAVSMRQFGVEIYVADLVVIGLLRELGPLITALILASRSGSAFAAELGTMKVNEEVNALVTMGLDPVRFLVLPRLVAAVCVLPLLTMFNNFFGLVGCGVVMVSLDIPLVTYFDRIREAASLTHLFGGLLKTFFFGALVGGIGCLRGLQTGTGPSAVGDAATRAVVSSIVAIVVVDGVFALVYYYLGI